MTSTKSKKDKMSKCDGSTKVKHPNWSNKESCLIVEMYEKYHDIIIGKFAGSRVTSKRKEEAWAKLETEFNQVNTDHHCDIDQIKFKISNIKGDACKFAMALKYHKTGSGPKPEDPPTFVQKMYEIIHDSTSGLIDRIGTGIESGLGSAHIGESSDHKEDTLAALSIAMIGSQSLTVPVSDSQHLTFDGVETQPSINLVEKTSHFQPSIKAKYPNLPFKKRGGISAESSSSSSSTANAGLGAKGIIYQSDIISFQKELIEEQLATVRENRLLIAEQQSLVVTKREYYKIKMARLQRENVGASVVITSTGTPSSNLLTGFNYVGNDFK